MKKNEDPVFKPLIDENLKFFAAWRALLEMGIKEEVKTINVAIQSYGKIVQVNEGVIYTGEENESI